MAGIVTSNLDPSTLVAPVLFSSSFARAANLMRRKHADYNSRINSKTLTFFLHWSCGEQGPAWQVKVHLR